jgi:hypothetical protein
MEALEDRGMGCAGCPGTCCTFEANSMLVTPLEAVELFAHLRTAGGLRPELREKLRETVARYRLEPKYPGGRSYLRKTYTCPFFNHGELGCPVPRAVKPYGCLAFDSHHVELKAGEHCYSEVELLKRREELHPEEAAENDRLRRTLNLHWEKAPIPNALLDLWDRERAD